MTKSPKSVAKNSNCSRKELWSDRPGRNIKNFTLVKIYPKGRYEFS